MISTWYRLWFEQTMHLVNIKWYCSVEVVWNRRGSTKIWQNYIYIYFFHSFNYNSRKNIFSYTTLYKVKKHDLTFTVNKQTSNGDIMHHLVQPSCRFQFVSPAAENLHLKWGRILHIVSNPKFTYTQFIFYSFSFEKLKNINYDTKLAGCEMHILWNLNQIHIKGMMLGTFHCSVSEMWWVGA